MTQTVGLLLAAGAGRRMGRPKALVEDDGGIAWVVSASRALRGGGCDEVLVVVGAEADRVRALLQGERVRVVDALDWADGMGASMRAGLLAAPEAAATLVHLVDLPDVGADVVGRLVSRSGPAVLARAAYDGVPGHPVLIGPDHRRGVVETLSGDHGARTYLQRHEVELVECGDLAVGLDIDEPPPMLGR